MRDFGGTKRTAGPELLYGVANDAPIRGEFFRRTGISCAIVRIRQPILNPRVMGTDKQAWISLFGA